MRPAPYVGVSGLVSRAEVVAALAAFPSCDRLLGVGVLASEKTLAAQRNKWWRRTPPIERIAGIFVDDPRCLNLIHFASDEPAGADTLLHLMERAGHLCHGFQFNGAWPRVSDLGALLRSFSRIAGRSPRIVLQVGPKMLKELDHTEAIIDRLRPFSNIATDVLIDFSGGLGKPVDAWKAGVANRLIRNAFSDLGVGIAGGLCAETLPGVAHLVRDGVSVDAEGKLRDAADGGGGLLQKRVAAYLCAAGNAASS